MNVPLANTTIKNPIVTRKNHQLVSQDHVFSYTDIDYISPIYVKNVYGSDFNKYKA